MSRAGRIIGIATLAGLLAGCFDAPQSARAPTSAPVGTQALAASQLAATPVPTDTLLETQPADSGPVVLTVWMPDTLYGATDSPGRQDFLDQLATFDDQRPDIRVQVIAKRLRGPGGILAYLRSAPPVAPAILPDVALVDRDALAEAARAQLVVPLSEVTQPTVISDLYPVALEVGQVDGGLVGLPYLLEIDHTVYRQTIIRRPLGSFTQILDSGQLFAFAGGATSGVSPVILVQYMAAGGTLADAQHNPALAADALTGVLSFYAQAKTRGNVTLELFQLTDTSAVWGFYHDRRANLAAVTSSQYLAGLSQVTSSKAGPIPTEDGKPYALARGWSWALVTRDPERQAAALALLEFLMKPANQGKYSEAAHWLPSQPAALALWAGQDAGYLALTGQLLASAQAMPDASARSSIGAPMQDALEAVVLNGETPAQAAAHAAEVVKNGQ